MMNTIQHQYQEKLSQDNKTRQIKIDRITERWEQQDTHTIKQRPTHSINKLQQIKQQQQHHRTRLIDKQRQTTSYNQWIQQQEQRKQQTQRQQIRLWNETYYQTMEIENDVKHTKQQKQPIKLVLKVLPT